MSLESMTMVTVITDLPVLVFVVVNIISRAHLVDLRHSGDTCLVTARQRLAQSINQTINTW